MGVKILQIHTIMEYTAKVSKSFLLLQTFSFFFLKFPFFSEIFHSVFLNFHSSCQSDKMQFNILNAI